VQRLNLQLRIFLSVMILFFLPHEWALLAAAAGCSFIIKLLTSDKSCASHARWLMRAAQSAVFGVGGHLSPPERRGKTREMTRLGILPTLTGGSVFSHDGS